jgi:EAL domain-containing protein (putative c-di-GMP-specific phosphodiesterase class I)
MWRCACRILAKWKKTNPDLFLSVNISPKDFYFMYVAEEIIALCRFFHSRTDFRI